MEIAGSIAEILGAILGLIDLVKGIGEDVKETVDVFVQGGTEIIGLGDAIGGIVTRSKNLLEIVFPSNFVAIIAVSFTVIIALATRRSMNG